VLRAGGELGEPTPPVEDDLEGEGNPPPPRDSPDLPPRCEGAAEARIKIALSATRVIIEGSLRDAMVDSWLSDERVAVEQKECPFRCWLLSRRGTRRPLKAVPAGGLRVLGHHPNPLL
jgi:hypothetical protein